ncbi:MAG: phosphoribosyltransferase family protein [Trueperaceae bacterium]
MATMTGDELAAAIYRSSHLTGEFVLRSGAIAGEYFDKYRFEREPRLLRSIAEALAPLVPPESDGLAGLELGGVPIATLLSQITGLPLFSVRKKAKEYGTRQLAEGGDVRGVRLVVVEDVVTSGGQVVISSGELRDLGASVETAICVINREAGGVQALAEAGIELRALFKMSELNSLR